MSRWDFGGNYADATASAITRLVLEHGAQAPSSRAIAEHARMSPSSLTSHFGGRDAMLRMSAASWATFHGELLRDRVHRREWDGFLPLHDEETAQARAWLCWRAMAIGDEEMSQAIRRGQREQESLLRNHLAWEEGVSYPRDSLEIRVVSGYLNGLVEALVDPIAPLGRDEVARVWEEHRQRLLEHGRAA